MTLPEDIEIGKSRQTDVDILGGGPGGYGAALAAARRGARGVLVEKKRLGGSCLNIGCIPTKVLATSAELLVHAGATGARKTVAPRTKQREGRHMS